MPDADWPDGFGGVGGVRRRPEMFIGSLGSSGLCRMFYSVLDYSVEEAVAEAYASIEVVRHRDNSISVRDYGRGMGITTADQLQLLAQRLVTPEPRSSKDVSGRWASVFTRPSFAIVNALSDEFDFVTRTDGWSCELRFCRGVPVTSPGLSESREPPGTYVWFRIDPAIFGDVETPVSRLVDRLRTLASLVPGLRLTWDDEVTGESFAFLSDGLTDLLERLNSGREDVWEPVLVHHRSNRFHLDVALQFNDSSQMQVLSWANHWETCDGAHMRGVLKGVSSAYPSREFDGKHIPGLTALVSLRVPNVHLCSATMRRLDEPWVARPIAIMVEEAIRQHPGDARGWWY